MPFVFGLLSYRFLLSSLTLFGQNLVGFSQIRCPPVFIRPDALCVMVSPQRTRLQSSQSRAMRALDPRPLGQGPLDKSVRPPKSSIGHRVQGASIVRTANSRLSWPNNVRRNKNGEQIDRAT